MTAFTRKPLRLTLEAGETLNVTPGRGTEIEARSGRIWITQAGDPRDHLLEPGDRFRAEGRRTIVVSSLESATLALYDGGFALPASLKVRLMQP